MQRSSNLTCVQRDTRTKGRNSHLYASRSSENWGVLVENGRRVESTGNRGSSSCSTVPSGKWLYSMELFARVGGRPIFTLEKLTPDLRGVTRAGFTYLLANSFDTRSTRLFPPTILFHPRNLEGYPSWKIIIDRTMRRARTNPVNFNR